VLSAYFFWLNQPREVLTRLPHMTNRQIPEVIPAAWVKTRRQEQQLAAS
jgi:hypothetical protein